ncbi:hypothetical protein CPAR01_00592 [Colletotrichum paranaense]|uniref:Secreted protein n=1 Tax=Colletotrichum paranaense TaxID=1914294 RepID=A0ABQ9T4C7_9PEZI|nr:uncharacterized protein CPAR01_00592 [Colletotrichum paranaense]KAK1546625.1 hypothetical protein CPAR01_00592 [Colletotrichum paranaense]
MVLVKLRLIPGTLAFVACAQPSTYGLPIDDPCDKCTYVGERKNWDDGGIGTRQQGRRPVGRREDREWIEKRPVHLGLAYRLG